MISRELRRLAREVGEAEELVNEDEVVQHGHILFEQPIHDEMQRAILRWDKGLSEDLANAVRQDEIKKLPESKDLDSLAEYMAEDRVVEGD